MTYYIGIAGTHSTGKTTFLSELKQLGEESGIKVEYISDTATKCQNMGFPILSDHTFESTLWIITSVIKSELEAGLNADLVLVDRPVPDAIGYLNAALKAQNRSISVEQKEYLYGIVEQHSRRYNLLLKTELDESIPLGEGRDSNLDFRRSAAEEINEVFSEFGLKFFTPHEENTTRKIAEILEVLSKEKS